MHQAEETEYDGCGKCLLGVRRLSRKSDTTHSPEKQAEQVIKAAAEVGAHIIGWADDWEVSGATDPFKRPKLGPWLRGENGPYDGIAGAAVDRIGRNVRDVLNTAYTIHEKSQILVTADHAGVWDLNDPNQESELLIKALGAQLEHRSTKRRVQDETARARNAGEPSNKLTYGYMYARLPNGKVEKICLHPEASKKIRNVAHRILADTTGNVTISTECSRLTREGVLTPHDLLAVMSGRDPKGSPWTYMTLRGILWSEAALGYLMHNGKPFLGRDGEPVRVAPPLWDRATRDALIKKTTPKQGKKAGSLYGRAAQGTKMLVSVAYCGNCSERLKIGGKGKYICKGRVMGLPGSQKCRPAPNMKTETLNAIVAEWFLTEYGSGQVLEKKFIPGTNYAAQISELEASRARLREDRKAGLYDASDDQEWYRQEYKRMGEKLSDLKKRKETPGRMTFVPTGETVADKWGKAKDDAERREILHEFEVHVKLFPGRSNDRVKITGRNVYELAG
ncbi:recombinase family protein [Streptomyces sp. NPDC054770]